MDLLRRVVSDSLDVHAAFRRNDEGNATDRAVDEQRAIEFAVDVGAIFDVEAVDLLAGRTRLGRDQRVAEHFLGECDDFVDRLGEANAALGVGAEFLELALAAATSMNLALDHVKRAGKRLGSRFDFFDLQNRNALGNRRSKALEQGLGLIFMNVHGNIL